MVEPVFFHSLVQVVPIFVILIWRDVFVFFIRLLEYFFVPAFKFRSFFYTAVCLTEMCCVEIAKGVEENRKVIVCPKHFAINEQETYRRETM